MPTQEEISMPAILGDKIREARRHMNMTQGELAGGDYSVSYISAIERNKIRPSLRALAWLAARLNINLSDLLSEDPALEHEILTATSSIVDDNNEVVFQAQRQVEMGDTNVAVELLLPMLEKPSLTQSTRSNAQFLLGRAYLLLGRAQDARDTLEGNLAMLKSTEIVLAEKTRNYLGLAYYKLNLFMIAADYHRQNLNAIESGIVLDPSFELTVRDNLANDYMALGQYDEAIEQLNEAAELGKQLQDPRSAADLYWEVAEGYRHNGQLHLSNLAMEIASNHLQNAQNQTIFAKVYSELGYAYVEKSDFDRAEELLSQATQTSDVAARSLAFARLSYVQRKKGENKKSIISADQAVALAEETDNVEVKGQAILAKAEAKAATNAKDAGALFEEAINILQTVSHPSKAYERYSEYLEQQGDMKKAIDYLRKAQVRTTSISKIR